MLIISTGGDGRVDDLGRRRSLSLEWDADNKYRGWEGG